MRSTRSSLDVMLSPLLLLRSPKTTKTPPPKGREAILAWFHPTSPDGLSGLVRPLTGASGDAYLGKRSTPGSQVVSAAFGRGAPSRVAPLWRHPAADGPPRGRPTPTRRGLCFVARCCLGGVVRDGRRRRSCRNMNAVLPTHPP